MPQIVHTEADRTTTVAARRVANLHSTVDLAVKPENTTLRLVEKAAATARELFGTSIPDGAKQELLLPPRKRRSRWSRSVVQLPASGSSAAAHNTQTLNKLAAARDWHEALAIQNSSFCDSLSRLNDGMSRYANEAGRIVARSRQARAGG